MAKLRYSTFALLLSAVAAVALPNGSHTNALLAHREAITTSLPTPTIAFTTTHNTFQMDLRRRQDSSSSATASSVPVANSFTMKSLSASLPGPEMNASAQASSAQATGTGMATGIFTANDGGQYGITSQSGYIVIDFKTLSPGQSALIGNEEVVDGAAGVVANGMTIPLTPVTTATPSSNTTVISSSITVAIVSTSTFESTSTRSMSAVSTISTEIPVSSTVSSAAAAARQTASSMMAAAGGLLGLMIL
ncbi:hypothetical protein LTR86_009958 [Recurvomyces mirabilis]|nr:hypothetical protein LTR86_009958 [Recurvomyces mirabilis]